MLTYTFKREILTHDPYRIVCDLCDWTTGQHSLVSAAYREIVAHLVDQHDSQTREPKPAPIKPSNVLRIVADPC